MSRNLSDNQKSILTMLYQESSHTITTDEIMRTLFKAKAKTNTVRSSVSRTLRRLEGWGFIQRSTWDLLECKSRGSYLKSYIQLTSKGVDKAKGNFSISSGK